MRSFARFDTRTALLLAIVALAWAMPAVAQSTQAAPSIQDLTTLSGISAFVLIALRLGQPFLWPNGGPSQAKWMQLYAVGAGIVAALLAAFVLEVSGRSQVGQVILNGIYGGIAAIGLYNPPAPTMTINAPSATVGPNDQVTVTSATKV